MNMYIDLVRLEERIGKSRSTEIEANENGQLSPIKQLTFSVTSDYSVNFSQEIHKKVFYDFDQASENFRHSIRKSGEGRFNASRGSINPRLSAFIFLL